MVDWQLPLTINLDFCMYRPNSSILFMSTTVCSSTYTIKFLPIIFVFCMPSTYSSLGFAVVYLPLHGHLIVVFQCCCSSISGIFCGSSLRM